MIQAFYNQLVRPHKIMAKNGKNENRKGLSAKSVKKLHGVLHKALQQAVLCQYVKTNPCDACKLPRVEKAKTNAIQVNERYAMTIMEAAKYYSIGIKRLRQMAEEHLGDFAIFHGNKYLIIRERFEEFLSKTSAI